MSCASCASLNNINSCPKKHKMVLNEIDGRQIWLWLHLRCHKNHTSSQKFRTILRNLCSLLFATTSQWKYLYRVYSVLSEGFLLQNRQRIQTKCNCVSLLILFVWMAFTCECMLCIELLWIQHVSERETKKMMAFSLAQCTMGENPKEFWSFVFITFLHERAQGLAWSIVIE